MATPAQLAANRANAQRSTGPRSVEGKSVSRFNALKHGMDASSVTLPGEDPGAYQALADAYAETYQPADVGDRFLLDIMIRADWQKQRLQRLEADLLRKLLAETPGASLLDAMLSDSPAAKLLARTQRQLAAHERAWFRAHKEYVRLANLAAENHNDVFERYLDHVAPEMRPAGSTPYIEPPEEDESPERTQSAAPDAVNERPSRGRNRGQAEVFIG